MYSNFWFLTLLVIGCSGFEEQNISGLEKRALEYFVENILYKNLKNISDSSENKLYSSLFLRVNKVLNSTSNSYVELYFKGIEQGLVYEEYNIYIVFDSKKNITGYFLH